MKKLIFNLGIVLSVIMCFSFFCCDDKTENDLQDMTLVCFGNSLTAGYGATTPGIDDKTKSYPAFLQTKVNIPVINAGVSGDTTTQALSRLTGDVLEKNPRIVIIELGANDLFRGMPISTTKSNLQSIIDTVNNGIRKIYIAKFYTETMLSSFVEIYGIDYIPQTVLINQYNDMFNSLVSLNDVILIDDIWTGVWGLHMSDPIHPNAIGYEIMADNYFNILKPYLLENGLLK